MIEAGFSQCLHRNLDVHENSSETGLIDPSAFRDGVLRDMGSSSARQTLPRCSPEWLRRQMVSC